MKKLLIAAALVLTMVSISTNDAVAQRVAIGVQVRPQPPNYRRPPMPGRGFAWVGESWRWQRGRYVFVPGYWMRPPSRHARYVQGRWDRNQYGWVWLDGYWMGKNNGRNNRYNNDWSRNNNQCNDRGYNDKRWDD